MMTILILYPSLENSTTGIAIILMNMRKKLKSSALPTGIQVRKKYIAYLEGGQNSWDGSCSFKHFRSEFHVKAADDFS